MRSVRAIAVAGALLVAGCGTGDGSTSATPSAGGGQVDRCTCGELGEQAAAADAVFVGTPLEIALESVGPAGEEELWRFDVEEHLAGPEAEAEVINVSGGGSLSNCRARFQPGQLVGIVAFWRNGHLATSRCGVVPPEALYEATGIGDGGE